MNMLCLFLVLLITMGAEEDFELFAMRNVGRGAMVTFTGLVTAGILGV